jgi:type IV pilus assembly protein PilY1
MNSSRTKNSFLTTSLVTCAATSVMTAFLSLVVISSATADDTEIFLKQAALPPEQLRPNVVFILDTSGSMGLPVDTDLNGTSARQEKNKYISSKSYDGFVNNSGGIGDDDYVYLYLYPNTYADQYIYYNKVHKNQMTCNMTTLTDSTPYDGSKVYNNFGDRYVYETGTSWLSSGTGSTRMCAEHEASCGFTPASNGPLVDCKSEENHITADSRYASDSRNNNLIAVSSNYHNYLQSYYRYTVLQTVMKDLVDENYDINMSLMRFNGSSGGYVFHESILAEDEDDPSNANQQSLRDAIDDIFKFSDSTPLTEVLWESYRYLKGTTADYGDNSGTNTPSGAYSSGTTYNSPIDYECQKSHIILLTDGAPTNDTGRNSIIQGNSYTGSNCSGNCLDEFTGWIRNNGASLRDHSTLDLTQDIKVHTIGFGRATDATLLKNAAANGGGDYKSASTAAELLQAFKELAGQTLFEKDTFVAPAVAVNAYSGLQHRNELYFALFQPTSTPRWSGNIKKYKLKNGKIMDSSATAKEAVNSVTGYFDKGALSYWTTPTNWDGLDHDMDGNDSNNEPDGNQIAYGGIAYELTSPNTRNLFTYIGSPLTNTGITPSPIDLSSAELLDGNTDITTNLLGLGASDAMTEIERTDVITWARGGDPLTPPLNYYVGDFIHNRPSVVTYTTTVDIDVDGNKVPTFDDTVFAASNVGFLHAIDTETGSEEFAFIPQELLGNLSVYYKDTGSFSDKVYGLDAPMTIWRNDVNGNGNIITAGSVDTGDHVYIYQAMRRGGTHMYAVDVTLRTNPKLLWQIDGTAYDGTPSGDYKDLAQTWSVPQKALIKRWGCTPADEDDDSCDRTVLFFGGGYDTAHDSALVPTTGDKGNAIYMVDAITGALLWSAGKTDHDLILSDMENSIPANVTASDVDGDGYVDFLFAVDIQGNVWRIDFEESATNVSNFAYGGKIAELGGTGNNFRRFFNAPDVAYFAERGIAPFLTVTVASGYRASPNETDINDHLFVVYDKHALYRPTDINGDPVYDYVGGANAISISDISDVSNVLSVPTKYGWYRPLNGTGEKGLSRTITFGDKIVMTTFLPSIAESCEGAEGSGRYYILDALTGAEAFSIENGGGGGGSLPYRELAHGGIPPEPAVIFTNEPVCIANCNDGDDTNDIEEERTDLVVCVGTECLDDALDQSIQKAYWREN